MSRYRWLRAEWPSAIRTVAKRLREHAFVEGGHSGFILDRIRDDFFEARYIERFEYQETVADPFGQEVRFERLEYRQTRFRATQDGPGFELIDAPRSAQALVNELLQATDYSLTIEPLVIDVLGWVDAIQASTSEKLAVLSLQVGALHLDEEIRGKFALKGNVDVRDAATELIGGKAHVVEKVQFRVKTASGTTAVTLSNNASAKLEGSGRDIDFLDVVRRALRIQSSAST